MTSDAQQKAYTELVLFIGQIMSIFVIICTSLVNLTFEWGNQNLWTLLLMVSLGYVMPNPKIQKFTEGLEKYKGTSTLEA